MPVKVSRSSNYPLGFLVPAVGFILVFFIAPTAYNFGLALTNWSSFKSEIDFVGLTNFQDLLANESLLKDLRTTLIYALLVAVFQNVFGLLLALLLERDTRLNRFMRTAFFIPVIMSALAAGYVFQALLKPDGGVNDFLGSLLGHEVSYAWLGDPNWTLVVVALIHSWKWMGLSMLIYLAGLKTINSEMLEASQIDGASRWRTFASIRFPLIAPALTFNVATALLGSLNGFDVVQATTQGGPGGTTELLNIFIFRAFGQGLFAQATAMSLVLLLMLMVIAIPLIWMLRKREDVL